MPVHDHAETVERGTGKTVPRRHADGRRPWVYWMALVAVILLSGMIRYRLIDVPLERDEGEYAYAGQLILQGVPPYQQVYNMKWPGIYAFYAVMMAVFGQTLQGIHTGLLIVNAVTIFLVFLWARHFMNPLAAVVSAAFFAVFSLSQSVHGTFANAEHFVILFAVGGLLLLSAALQDGGGTRIFFAGILLGLAAVTKQHAILFFFAAIVGVLVVEMLRKPRIPKRLVKNAMLISTGWTLVVLVLFGVMFGCGVFKQFWFWTIDYARMYIAQVTLASGIEVFLSRLPGIFGAAPLLWVLALLGIAVTVTTRQLNRLQKALVLILAVGSFAAICPGLFFRKHYFILLLPSAALLSGISVSFFSDWISARFRSHRMSVPISILIGVAAIGQSVLHESRYLFRMSPLEVCRSTFYPSPFVESVPIAEYIRQHTSPADTIAVIGSEPQIFFYAQRRSASAYVYLYPLMEDHRFAFEMQKDFIRQTELKKPAYCIVVHVPQSWLQTPSSHTLVIEWMQPYLQAHYEMVGSVELYEDETLYHWSRETMWPVSSPYYVLVFKRISP